MPIVNFGNTLCHREGKNFYKNAASKHQLAKSKEKILFLARNARSQTPSAAMELMPSMSKLLHAAAPCVHIMVPNYTAEYPPLLPLPCTVFRNRRIQSFSR
jgi:hypothetical protein